MQEFLLIDRLSEAKSGMKKQAGFGGARVASLVVRFPVGTCTESGPWQHMKEVLALLKAAESEETVEKFGVACQRSLASQLFPPGQRKRRSSFSRHYPELMDYIDARSLCCMAFSAW
eukprot:s2032_g15.t1